MNALRDHYPLSVIAFASPVYWPDPIELERSFAAVCAHLAQNPAVPLTFHLVTNVTDECKVTAKLAGRPVVLLPMSGAVQPLMVALASPLTHVGLANAYLPDFLPPVLASLLLERNAHPACTDFFANRRLAGRPARWLESRESLLGFARAHQAVQRLRAARLLKIGETEPWVINSTRDPARFRSALGCEIVPLPSSVLYEEFARVSDADAAKLAEDWVQHARLVSGPAVPDVVKAARVVVAMRRLLAAHSADALSMACFAMIGSLDTTSCVALSTLNDSADAIGACEGDLDAAVTLFLLKALGADFVWIANPIVHEADCIDLAHCTAPRCGGGAALPYRLFRHHESGRGVAPEVQLPAGRTVTLARIGANLTELVVHPGQTMAVAKQPTCHTQVRVRIPSSRRFLSTLLGTHVVMSFGDFQGELEICAELLGLRFTGTSHESFATTEFVGPPPLFRCTCETNEPATQMAAVAR
jgi:hypothetical protein